MREVFRDHIIMIVLVCSILFIVAAILIGYGVISNAKSKKEHKVENTVKEKVEYNLTENNETNSIEEIANGQPFTLEEIENPEITKKDTGRDDLIREVEFYLNVSDNLKNIGYDVFISDDNHVLNVVSKDKKYAFKLMRLSNMIPYTTTITEEQQAELDDILQKIANEACAAKGITESSPDYVNAYYNEYGKDMTNQEVLNFYNTYGINRFSSFSGLSEQEILSLRDVLGANSYEYTTTNTVTSDGMIKKTHTFNNGRLSEVEIAKGSYNFNGMFMVLELYDGFIDDGYKIDFSMYNKDNTAIIEDPAANNVTNDMTNDLNGIDPNAMNSMNTMNTMNEYTMEQH